MSIAETVSPTSVASRTRPRLSRATEQPIEVQEVVAAVRAKLAPVWPLQDFVAINPYAGLTSKSFLAARRMLQSVSDAELFMPIDYYRQQFREHRLMASDVQNALAELRTDDVAGSDRIDLGEVLSALKSPIENGSAVDRSAAGSINSHRAIRSVASMLDRVHQTDWSSVIMEEVSKHCATHYDEGQAMWSSRWRERPLFEAWRQTAQYDRNLEVLGVPGFRKSVARLPDDPYATLTLLLHRLNVPENLWEPLLLCTAMEINGWSAWTKYRHQMAEREGNACDDLAGLLAIRLAMESAVAKQLSFEPNWAVVANRYSHTMPGPAMPSRSEITSLVLLRADEIALRRRLIGNLVVKRISEDRSGACERKTTAESSRDDVRPLAQLVFCIDVRSEPFRRRIEAQSNQFETFGFAGFFGLPIEYVPFGETEGRKQLPVLLSPQLRVREQLDFACDEQVERIAERRTERRWLKKSWKEFQSSATSCFSFVESIGLSFGWQLIQRSFGWSRTDDGNKDGLTTDQHNRLRPVLEERCAEEGGVERMAALAESMVRGIGLGDRFGKFVILAGHESQTENNPLQASLDCGACGGHSGEPNARLAAALLNHEEVRAYLQKRGIEIPADTVFLPAVHNTTTDELRWFDTECLSDSAKEELRFVQQSIEKASRDTRAERSTRLVGQTAGDALRRCRDWSEVRPEWGLAGNAAFIAAPREMTRSLSLEGRVFLHSYDHQRDSGYEVLEQIMTAPLIVAHWINMQYYASAVDPIRFGSGTKTVHNVVGRFGILSGGGGDLRTGLPWQSIHDGYDFQHQPLRLLALVAAPRSAIEGVLAEHPEVEQLLTNQWMQLVAHDGGVDYRFTADGRWAELSSQSYLPKSF